MAKQKKAAKHIHNKHPKLKPVKQPGWHLPVILVLTFIIYIPVLNAGFVNWDDPDYVGENNFLIRNLSKLPEFFTTPVQGNYHPLTMLSLALNYAISGEDAWSYHLFNLIFHLINCILVYRFIFLLTKNNSLVAFITSLLFAIHPLHVESVAWVSERKDVLYTLFFIAGHISFTKFIDTGNKKQYWLTLLFVILSLMSKPAAVIFPVSLFCIDILRNRKFSVKGIIEKIPFFIPAILIGLLTISAQKEVGATGGDQFTFAKNILFGFYGIMMYFIKMIIPFGQSAFYPLPALNEKLPMLYYVAPLFSLLLAVIIYLTWKKHRYVAFGISFYIINLLLVLQFFSVGSAIIAERYTYVPYIGLFFIAGVLLDRFSKNRILKAYGVITPVAIIFSVLTYKQTHVWKDGASLWDNVIKNQPSSRAYSSRGMLFRREGNKLKQENRMAEAEQLYRRAIEYYSKAISLNVIDHESYNNRANIYTDLNKPDSALPDYKQALAIKPDFYLTLDNLGALYARKGMNDSALYFLNKSIEQKPGNRPTYSNRALTLMALRKYEEAIKDWQKFLSFQPDVPDADALNTMAVCYRMVGKYSEAINYINQAIQIRRDGRFYLNRAYSYFGLKDNENARNDALIAKQSGVTLDASFAASLGIQ
jgi:protein O-mannosyl-transferase